VLFIYGAVRCVVAQRLTFRSTDEVLLLCSGALVDAFAAAVINPIAVADHPLLRARKSTSEEDCSIRGIHCSEGEQTNPFDVDRESTMVFIGTSTENPGGHCARFMPPVQYAENMPLQLVAVGHHVGSMEFINLTVFLRYMNSYTTLVHVSDLREGLSTAADLPCEKHARVRTHASQATLWACVAVGAVAQYSPFTQEYFYIARQHVQVCFDVPCRETFAAMCAIAYSSYFADPKSFCMYAGFALTIFLELEQHFTLEEKQFGWTALQVLRNHAFNALRSSAEFHNLTELLEEYSILDSPAWVVAAQNLSIIITNPSQRLWGQMPQAFPRSSSPDAQPMRALDELQSVCDQVQLSGQITDDDPVLQKLFYMSRMGISAYLARFDEAAIAARALVKTLEANPTFLTWASLVAVHALLDAAQMLCHDMSKRIQVLKKRLPEAPLNWNEDDLFSTVCTNIRNRLLMHLPLRALSIHEPDADDDVFAFEEVGIQVTEAMASFQAL
jgi:hypothetical protein